MAFCELNGRHWLFWQQPFGHVDASHCCVMTQVPMEQELLVPHVWQSPPPRPHWNWVCWPSVMQVLFEQQPVGQVVLSQSPPTHAPSLQTAPAAQVRHCAPLSPQLVAFCAVVGMQTVPAQQPSVQVVGPHCTPPPPAPAVPPPKPPPWPALPPPAVPPSLPEPGTQSAAMHRHPLPQSRSFSHCCSSTAEKHET